MVAPFPENTFPLWGWLAHIWTNSAGTVPFHSILVWAEVTAQAFDANSIWNSFSLQSCISHSSQVLFLTVLLNRLPACKCPSQGLSFWGDSMCNCFHISRKISLGRESLNVCVRCCNFSQPYSMSPLHLQVEDGTSFNALHCPTPFPGPVLPFCLCCSDLISKLSFVFTSLWPCWLFPVPQTEQPRGHDLWPLFGFSSS